MTRQEVIDAFKSQLSRFYNIRISTYKDGKLIEMRDTAHPESTLNFDRSVIEAALELLEK